MSNFYIKTKLQSGEVVFYFLDATSQIRVSHSAKLSQNPMANGESAADNYTRDPLTISVSGRISDIKSATPEEHSKSTKQFLDGLKKIMDSDRPVSMLYHVGRPEAENCYFTQLDIIQDSGAGYAGIAADTGEPVNAYKISFVLQQALYARGAQITTAPASEFKNAFQEKVKSTANTQQPDEVNSLIVNGFTDIATAASIAKAANSGQRLEVP